MSITALNTVLAICIGGAIFLFWMSFYPEDLSFLSRKVLDEEEEDFSVIQNAKTIQTKIMIPLARKISRYTRKKIKPEELMQAELDLKAAGSPFDMKPIEYCNMKYAYFIGFMGLGAFLHVFAGIPFLIAPVMGLAASTFPSTWIKKLIVDRTERAEIEIPSMLDLISVCMESGMTLLGSLSVICEKNEGLLVTEFERVRNDVNSGASLKDSFYELTLRLRSKKVKMLYNNVKLSEEFGTPISDKLKVMADSMREDSFEMVKQRAAKAATMVMAPVAIFIFPSLMIILGGPIMVQFQNAG